MDFRMARSNLVETMANEFLEILKEGDHEDHKALVAQCMQWCANKPPIPFQSIGDFATQHGLLYKDGPNNGPDWSELAKNVFLKMGLQKREASA